MKEQWQTKRPAEMDEGTLDKVTGGKDLPPIVREEANMPKFCPVCCLFTRPLRRSARNAAVI